MESLVLSLPSPTLITTARNGELQPNQLVAQLQAKQLGVNRASQLEQEQARQLGVKLLVQERQQLRVKLSKLPEIKLPNQLPRTRARLKPRKVAIKSTNKQSTY
jgi:hypothetical protein